MPRVRGARQHTCSVCLAGHSFRSVPAREAAKQSASLKGSRGLQPCHAESGPRAPPPAPRGPRPKPKTVSELLREKRLREARARKAAPGAVVLPPQLLLSSPLALQPRLPVAPHGPSASGLAVTASVLSRPSAPAATEPCPSGSRASAEDGGPSTLPVLAGALASTEAAPAASMVPVLGPSQVPVNCHRGGPGQSQAPAATQKQGLPEAPPFLPVVPSPSQLPVQPICPTPAVGTPERGPQVVAGTPLPVTWVLTAQGLLPVPTVVGLPGPAGTSDSKGLSVALSSSLPGTQIGQGPGLPGPNHPWQPPTSRDTDSDPPSKTDPPGLPMPHQSQGSMEVDRDGAHGPAGGSFPGEAQVAGDTAVSGAPSQATLLADHPEAKSPRPSQPPLRGGTGPGSGPGGTAGSTLRPERLGEPLGLERPPPPRPGPERGALDLDLVSQEGEAVVREWLRGRRGVSVPPLGGGLPYQPPALCSLRALSALLLQKAALERRAASLVPGGAGALHASLGQVRRWLRDSPAYLLLKARFLAAFTLPALLATLSPDGVPTTLSVATRADPESEDDLGLEESELTDGCSTSGPRAGPAAATPIQVGGRGHVAPTQPPRGRCGCPAHPEQRGQEWVGAVADWLLRRKLALGSVCADVASLEASVENGRGRNLSTHETPRPPLGPLAWPHSPAGGLSRRAQAPRTAHTHTRTPAGGPARPGPRGPSRGLLWRPRPQKSLPSRGGKTPFPVA